MPSYKVVIKECWIRTETIEAEDPDRAAEIALNGPNAEEPAEYSHTDDVRVYAADDEYCERPLIIDPVQDDE